VLGISTRYWAPSGKRSLESGKFARSLAGRPAASSDDRTELTTSEATLRSYALLER
jgi:hypothetical protein